MVAGQDDRVEWRTKSRTLYSQGPRYRTLKPDTRIPVDGARYRIDRRVHRPRRRIDGLGAFESNGAREGPGSRAPADRRTKTTRAAPQAGALPSTGTSVEGTVRE